MADPVNVTVLGAGVIGLTTALVLSQQRSETGGPKYAITLLAKHMPGDYDIEYASPWAGANYLPVGVPGTLLQRFERDTWPALERLAGQVCEAGIHFQETYIYGRKKDIGTPTGDWFRELVKEDAWFRDVLPNFRVLPKTSLPPGIDSATAFTSVCINTAIYLSYLASQCLAQGVIIKRAIIPHIAQAALLHHTGKPAAVVVNCTGLSAGTLGGVQDPKVYPARGQIVIVRNEAQAMHTISGTDDGGDETGYIMQRAAGGGTILGGCLQAHATDPNPDPDMAIRIMQRCIDLCPALVDDENCQRLDKGKNDEKKKEKRGIEALSIVRHGVGLRPMREGGPRVEKERLASGLWVVHNYGHGGYGYQASYGSAEEARGLVEEAVASKARL